MVGEIFNGKVPICPGTKEWEQGGKGHCVEENKNPRARIEMENRYVPWLGCGVVDRQSGSSFVMYVVKK